jgi:putative membrane protein
MLSLQKDESLQRGFSFWIGLAFIVLGALTSAAAIAQYRAVLRTLKPVEIPEGYRANLGVVVNSAVAVLGVSLTVYLFVHGASP